MSPEDKAFSTLARAAKGALAPPPPLVGEMREAADAIAAWPAVQATVHWHFADPSKVNGIDFYVGEEELCHIHLDESVHLATSPELGSRIVAEGYARAFPYARGWVTARVADLGAQGTVALFRRNYERLRTDK